MDLPFHPSILGFHSCFLCRSSSGTARYGWWHGVNLFSLCVGQSDFFQVYRHGNRGIWIHHAARTWIQNDCLRLHGWRTTPLGSYRQSMHLHMCLCVLFFIWLNCLQAVEVGIWPSIWWYHKTEVSYHHLDSWGSKAQISICEWLRYGYAYS